MTKTLNIPIKLMKRYRKDRTEWELFVFAVCLKCLDSSSAIRPTVPLVRKLLGCSYYKAERMIERAKSDTRLFIYYPKSNVLIARNFKSGNLKRSEKSYRKTSYIARYAFCYKFRYELSDDSCRISHVKVSRMLQDALLVHAIKARQLKNVLPCKDNVSDRSTRRTALHSRRLGRIAGCHYSTAMRHIRKLEKTDDEEKNRKEGRCIEVTRPGIIYVRDDRTKRPLTSDPRLLCRRGFLLRTGYEVVRDCNEYRVDESNEDVFVNVIFNHKGRWHENEKTKDVPHHRRWFNFINR